MTDDRGGPDGRTGTPFWKSPTWLSAIAALMTAVVAVVALFAGGGDSSKGPSAPDTTTTSSADSPELALPIVRTRADVTEALGIVARANGLPKGPGYDEFTVLEASSGSIGAEVPSAWQDVEVSNWLDDNLEPIGLGVFAADGDFSRVYNAWDTSAILTFVSEVLFADFDGEAFLKRSRETRQEECLFAGGNEVQLSGTEGYYFVWADCGGPDSMLFEYATRSDAGYVTSIYAKLTTRSDIAAIDRVLATLDVKLPLVSITEAETP